ncbi:hemagglutinin, partial [Mycoplasmopsis synoviae]
SSAAPSGANTADHAKTIKDVNVYLNYTGPAIVLDATLPVVGKVDNTTTNGTSNVTDDLNTKFKDLVTSDQRTASLFFQAIQKYVNTFDPKYPANSISDQKNGVTWARVENKALKIANLNNPNAVFVQQMKDDSEAVYLPVIGVANNRWLNTFLIRIPLTKFVKPLTVFTATPASTPTQDSSASNTSPQTTT